MALGIVVIGVSQVATGAAVPIPARPDSVPFGTEALGILLLLRAFAGGSVALTGVEAIVGGIPAFKPPESKNAANTMTVMAVLLGILFVGLTVVSVAYGLRPTEAGGASIVAMAAEVTFGVGSPLVPVFAASTALISSSPRTRAQRLRVSRRSSPRTASCRQFAFRGDRLAFSWASSSSQRSRSACYGRSAATR